MTGSGDQCPLVSVVIPMRNEQASIGDCLESVLAQNYPAAKMEVLVVDGDSTDESAAVVRGFEERTGGQVRLLFNPARIVPPGLNLAIREARGEIIVRVDGHTRVSPDYVRQGVETLLRTGADNAGGAMTAVGGGVLGDAVARVTSSRFGVGSYFHFGTEECEVDTVYLGMWPRDVFARIGLFDEELVRNQDDELNYRLRKAGGRIVLNPAIQSRYQNRQSFRHLAKQYFQYGMYKVRVLQKHPRQMSWRHFVPPLFVLGLAAMAVLAPFYTPAAVLGGAGAVAYLVAIGLLAANLSARDGFRAWAAAWAGFAIVHFSWGAGFLIGIVRFGHRWAVDEPDPPMLAVAAVGEGAVPNDSTMDDVVGGSSDHLRGGAS